MFVISFEQTSHLLEHCAILSLQGNCCMLLLRENRTMGMIKSSKCLYYFPSPFHSHCGYHDLSPLNWCNGQRPASSSPFCTTASRFIFLKYCLERVTGCMKTFNHSLSSTALVCLQTLLNMHFYQENHFEQASWHMHIYLCMNDTHTILSIHILVKYTAFVFR